MHIHPNNDLQLASLGLGREELQRTQAMRAAEVRRRLSTAAGALGVSEENISSAAGRVERHFYKQQQGSEEQGREEDESFGSLFSVKV